MNSVDFNMSRFRGYKLPFVSFKGYRHNTFSRNFAKKVVYRGTKFYRLGKRWRVSSNNNLFQVSYTDPVNSIKHNMLRRKKYKIVLDSNT